MNKSILLVTLILVGCSTTKPVLIPSFPEPPIELMIQVPELTKL
jgi:hypothetical protein